MINNAIPLRIAGVGYSVPKTVVTNEDLTKLYDTLIEAVQTVLLCGSHADSRPGEGQCCDQQDQCHRHRDLCVQGCY